MKAESLIKHKEEMGNDLKFIDFHQLQIENKKHVKDIDERNTKLLDLKLATAKVIHKLNEVKKKLAKEIDKNTKAKINIEEMKKEEIKIEEAI